MLIPRRTKIERAGIVVSIASLLVIVIGAIAVAPDTIVGVHVKPAVVFNQVPGAERRACIKRITAQQEKSPQGVGTFENRFGNSPPESLCADPNSDDGVNGFRTLSPGEYTRAYMHNVIAALNWAGHSVTEKFLYWGARFLIVGLFLMYLFGVTIGPLLRFIWRGSMRA